METKLNFIQQNHWIDQREVRSHLCDNVTITITSTTRPSGLDFWCLYLTLDAPVLRAAVAIPMTRELTKLDKRHTTTMFGWDYPEYAESGLAPRNIIPEQVIKDAHTILEWVLRGMK